MRKLMSLFTPFRGFAQFARTSAFRKYFELSANASEWTAKPRCRRYMTANTAVVLVFPSMKGWICQIPEMNSARCAMASPAVSPL